MNALEYFPNEKGLWKTLWVIGVKKTFSRPVLNLQLTLLALIEVGMPNMLLGNTVLIVKIINTFAPGLRGTTNKLQNTR